MPAIRLPYEFPPRCGRLGSPSRAMADGDVDDIYAYHSRPDVCRYLPLDSRTHDGVAEKVAKHSAALVRNGDGDYWQLAVERLSDRGWVIGDVYFTIKSATGEIGWTLHPDFTGSGYMTEAERHPRDRLRQARPAPRQRDARTG